MSVYLICYAASFLFARIGYYKMSGIVLIMAALYLYWSDYRRSGSLIHLRGLFALFWVGGEGISCLKLSKLQTDWTLTAWVCFLLAVLGFWFTYEELSRRHGNPNLIHTSWHGFKGYETPLFLSMAAVTLVSALAFIFEAVALGFIPLLVKGVPHAYSVFHITGVHYFTVSCVLVPALSVIYFSIERGRSVPRAVAAITMDVISFLIPLLCVSRFQMILAAGMAVFAYLALQARNDGFSRRGIGNLLAGLALIVVMACFYVVLTIARGHDVAYLNGIFEMKNGRTPIFLTQPYIYVANNYDNFNCLVEMLPGHTYGLRMLFPVWALTGLKFIAPYLVNFPIYVTKEELTTVTLFYDAYYDFGVAGVLLFSCFLGAVCYVMMKDIKRLRNPVGYLFYAQMGMYLVLSFFTTWFSNPTTWFYLAVTWAIYGFCAWKGN